VADIFWRFEDLWQSPTGDVSHAVKLPVGRALRPPGVPVYRHASGVAKLLWLSRYSILGGALLVRSAGAPLTKAPEGRPARGADPLGAAASAGGAAAGSEVVARSDLDQSGSATRQGELPDARVFHAFHEDPRTVLAEECPEPFICGLGIPRQIAIGAREAQGRVPAALLR
jgi:hypothetical protein